MIVLALIIIACPTAEAGKKRRNASLDQLKERSPSERWKVLQKLWRSEDQSPPAQPLQVVAPAPPVALPAGPAESANPASSEDSTTEAGHASEAVPYWERDLDQMSAKQSVLSDEGATDVSYHQDVEEDAMSMDGIDASTPKPITSILPYYDYSPSGEDPCNFLCPQPGECPEDTVKKPCPDMVELPDVPFEERMFADTNVTWAASNLYSNPLYFEDAALERYGHTHNCVVQPFVSVGKFGVQLVGLPYQMALHPICERRYALGWYRPGECAPYKYYLPPWNTKAAVTAGAVYTGLFYLIP